MAKKFSLKKLNAELKKNPDNPELLRQRAWLILAEGIVQNFILAEKDIMHSLKIEPNSPDGLRCAAFCYYQKEDPKRGLIFAKKACSLEPNNSTNYYFRGICNQALMNLSKAVRDFSNVKPSDVKYYDALDSRALCFMLLQNYKKAIADYYTLVLAGEGERLLYYLDNKYYDHLHDLYQQQPNNAVYNFLKGWLTRDNPQTAIDYYSAAIRNDPHNAVFYSYRGKEYSKVSLNAEAIADFSKAIELDPLNNAFYALRADLYTKLKYFQSAFDDLDEAIKIKPTADLYFSYAETCMSAYAMDQEDSTLIRKAESSYLKAIKKYPTSIKFKVKLAKLYKEAGKDDDAVKYLLKAHNVIPNIPFEIDPDDHYELMKSMLYYFPESEYILREIAEREDFFFKDPQKSIENYSALIQLNPRETEYYVKRASKYFEIHSYENALKDLEISKSHGEIELPFMAMCFMKLSNFRKALQLLEQAEEELNTQLWLDKSYCYFMLNDEKASLAELKGFDQPPKHIKKHEKFTIISDEYFYFLENNFDDHTIHGVSEAFIEFISLVIAKSSYCYLLEAIRRFFLLDKLNFPTIKLVSDAEIFDKWENQSNPNYHTNRLEPYSHLYPEFEESWKFVLERDGIVLFNLRLKLVLIETLESILKRPVSHAKHHQDHINIIIEALHTIKENLHHLINVELAKRHEKEIANARVHERNKIISDLSHSIKNMVSTIIDPLENLKNENKLQPQVLENALRGANLIREIVNAMNLSFKGSAEDFLYDAKHADGSTALALQEMLRQSIVYSITNMFDGKYFNVFMRQYFNEKDFFLSAKTAWENVSHSPDLRALSPFLEEYFFLAEFNIDLSGQLTIGNDKGSAIKLLILFQEIVLNAVKYCSFVPKSHRLIKIDLQESGDKVIFRVENSYKKDVVAKTTGIGHILIDNFASLLNANTKISKNEEKYNVEICFPNFWKEMAQ